MSGVAIRRTRRRYMHPNMPRTCRRARGWTSDLRRYRELAAARRPRCRGADGSLGPGRAARLLARSSRCAAGSPAPAGLSRPARASSAALSPWLGGPGRGPGPGLRPRRVDPRWAAGRSALRAALRTRRRPHAPGPWAVLVWAAAAAHRFAALRRPAGPRLCPPWGAGACPLLDRSGHLPDHDLASGSYPVELQLPVLCPDRIYRSFQG